ncbi:MAG: PilZ domain-containing protein [Elusimicrobiota bacterium]
MDIKRRKYPRIVYTAGVDISDVTNRKISYKGIIKNISLGGLAIETENDLPIGGELRFAFLLPNKKNITTIGKVLWEYKDKVSNYYGVQFVLVGFFSRLKLKRFINSNLPKT